MIIDTMTPTLYAPALSRSSLVSSWNSLLVPPMRSTSSANLKLEIEVWGLKHYLLNEKVKQNGWKQTFLTDSH
ncbi:hypothetical protein DPMN_083048 [Dreissena polymorpha]|uniref:Uncharacterized protein n=1 Tax=Dreissena polymorpha TaxID=45954 RepID=A0A9D3YB59_DREPO|nr:hypothetical protein DPMN_083048 [Dreissena polymorpha]